MYFVYLSGVQSFSPSLGKDSPICSCFSSHFFCEIIWYLLYIRHISSILCTCFQVISINIGHLFLQILAKVKSLVGLGQSLVAIDVVFLVVGLLSIVSTRLGFQDLIFAELVSLRFFIAQGWLHGLLILFCLFLSLCSLMSLHLSSLIMSLVALPLCAWKVVYGLKLKLWFLGDWLSFSPLRLFIFFSCILWCRCVELVFWSFGFFYSKFHGSSLAWALCMCLFSF